MQEAKRVNWEKAGSNLNRIQLWIYIGLLLTVLMFILVDTFFPGECVFESVGEMKKTAAGTYTCYEYGEPLYQIHISGDTLTKHWCKMGSEYDSRISIKSWNRKRGTFEAAYALCKIMEDGNITCDDTLYERTATIEIAASDWSGWNENDKPTAATQTYTVRKGDVIWLGGITDLEVTLTGVSDKSISFDTNAPMSSGDSGIDLDANTTRFTLDEDGSLQLLTPTMDAGDIFVFKLVKAFDY